MDNRNNRQIPGKVKDIHPTELRRGNSNVDPNLVHIKKVSLREPVRKVPDHPAVKKTENAPSTSSGTSNGRITVRGTTENSVRTSGVTNVRYLRRPGADKVQVKTNPAVPAARPAPMNKSAERKTFTSTEKSAQQKTASASAVPGTSAAAAASDEKEAYTRNIMNLILCGIFAFMIIGMFLVVSAHMLNGNKPTYSEFEKRNLEPAPELSFATLADGSFTENFDKFFSDNFPMREKLVEGATVLKRFCGIRAFKKDAKQVIHGDADIYSSGDLEIKVDEDKFNNAEAIVIQGLPTTDDGQSTVPGSDETILPGTDPMTGDASQTTGTEQDPTAQQPTDPAVTDPQTQTPATDVQTPDTGEIPGDAPVYVGTPKGEKRDTIYLVGDTAFEYFRGSTKSASDYINVINTYAKYIPASVNIYDLVIPTHPEFGLEGADRAVSNEQKPVIQHIKSNLDSRVKFVDAYDKLYSHYKAGEYLYYRTDHHWTIRGAYQAYVAFCEKAGITPVPAENYETGRIEPFLGTFYGASRQEPALKNNPDYVEYFKIDIPCTVTRYDANGNPSKGGLYYTRVKGEANGYLAFMGGDFPYINIQTQNMNGRKLMIFKESFGNPLIGLLAPHFQEIHVADIRYFPYNSINFINQYGITDVLFSNGIMSANSGARVSDLLGLMNK